MGTILLVSIVATLSFLLGRSVGAGGTQSLMHSAPAAMRKTFVLASSVLL
jgi:hypothetical protein